MARRRSVTCSRLDYLGEGYQHLRRATIDISITAQMRAWVETKVAAGDFATASDCLRDLVRERMNAEAELAALKQFQDRSESGPGYERSQDTAEESRSCVDR